MINLRATAAKVLVRVTRNGDSLDQALAFHEPNVPLQDRALFREICYGSLRWHIRLEALLQPLLRRPLRKQDLDLHELMLAGIYQLTYLRIPVHAAVNETVNAARQLKKPWAKGLINGVLRNYQRSAATLQSKADQLPETRYSYPKWMTDHIRRAWPDHWMDLIDQGNRPGPMTLRVNLSRISREAYIECLAAAGINAVACPIALSGVRLLRPVNVTLLPGFSEGLASVQDEAAQICVSLLNPSPGSRILDACAAPGGKTGALLEKVGGDASMVALDISPDRCDAIRSNLDRLGYQAKIQPADASRPADWWDGNPFDSLLLDAPCSGSGVIRRHPDIKLLRRPADLARYSQRQIQILDALWPLLRSGGTLVYATCSIFPEENQLVIRNFLNEKADASEVEIQIPGSGANGPGLQLFPEADGRDGFYYALITKS